MRTQFGPLFYLACAMVIAQSGLALFFDVRLPFPWGLVLSVAALAALVIDRATASRPSR